MIQIKKTILTLVALLAVTTGAWADGTVTVTEIKASEMPTSWDNNNNPVKATDLPGFTAVTRDEAKALGAPAAEGDIYVFYAISNNVFMGLHWNNGVLDDSDGGFSLGGIYALQDVFKFYYVAAASSGPKVAWDKDKNTGTFTMPGGNVTLEPEYYPQATLAFQGLTAAEDAAAKTEAPLAVVADGAVTGGTLMYYVATDKNFSQADAIALAETQWSADIPTAETIDAAGTYIMWYYIKGDAEHSDTDPIPLVVTLLPEPTYTVEFAEGTPETDKWTADPNAGVKKGQTVTVTYTGAKKVIGVKAEKKKAAEKTITIGEQNYTVLNGETWKQFITRNQLSGWYLDQMTLSTWGVYINEPFSKLHVSSDGTNWTQLVLSSQDAPIDTDKQYKWVQEEIGGGGAPF